MARSKEKKARRQKKPEIKRITVDERLGDSSIRLLVASLASKARVVGKEINVEDTRHWLAEQAVYAKRGNEKPSSTARQKHDLLSVLGLGGDEKSMAQAMREVIGKVRRKATADLLWLALEETQVFITGNFSVEGDRFSPKRLTVSKPSTREFLRIDRAERFKNECKSLYAEALCGKEQSDE